VADALKDGMVPIGLLQGATTKRKIEVSEYVTWDDVDLDESQTIYQLRKQQDALGL
jgi:predicted homoserine dehydrogenase-like protein